MFVENTPHKNKDIHKSRWGDLSGRFASWKSDIWWRNNRYDRWWGPGEDMWASPKDVTKGNGSNKSKPPKDSAENSSDSTTSTSVATIFPSIMKIHPFLLQCLLF